MWRNSLELGIYTVFPRRNIFYLLQNIVRLSVSESLEWVCTKTIFPNGTIARGCEQTYTGVIAVKDSFNRAHLCVAGGETISICFWNDNNGEKVEPKCSSHEIFCLETPKKCLCSRQKCNSSWGLNSVLGKTYSLYIISLFILSSS